MTVQAPSQPLTEAQQRIVEWGDGPLVVIAGAGTGETRVIVERVRWLLETKGDATTMATGDLKVAAVPEPATGEAPFAGPLMPEQVLVLTYNVKAAKELSDRIEAAIGPAARARLPVSNFHSFCHRILTASAADAGLPSQPDVLDGIGQVLLLRDIRPNLPLLYYAGASNPNYWLDQFVAFINRSKDELVTPDDFDAFVSKERAVFEQRHGRFDEALKRIEAQGNLSPLRAVRAAYADQRQTERAQAGQPVVLGDRRNTNLFKAADREARRTVSGLGQATRRWEFPRSDLPRIDDLTETYIVDGAALEVLRLSELALVYRAYQDELAARGALDFGEQISLTTRLFKQKPNVLRRYQRQEDVKMRRLATSLAVAVLILGSLAPAQTHAAEPFAQPVVVQTVGLQHVNDGLGPTPDPGEMSTQNKVYGNCGWASFYIYPRGSGRALLAADAGTSYWAPIVFADYRIDWWNDMAGTSGWITGQTYQYSWTWSTEHERYTSTGWVYGQLSRLFVRHQDGHACVGLVPSDTTWIE